MTRPSGFSLRSDPGSEASELHGRALRENGKQEHQRGALHMQGRGSQQQNTQEFQFSESMAEKKVHCAGDHVFFSLFSFEKLLLCDIFFQQAAKMSTFKKIKMWSLVTKVKHQ